MNLIGIKVMPWPYHLTPNSPALYALYRRYPAAFMSGRLATHKFEIPEWHVMYSRNLVGIEDVIYTDAWLIATEEN